MTKYDNFIYLTICEITLKLHKQTGFNSHVSYCRWMGVSLSDARVINLVKNHTSTISDMLNNIFTMDAETSGIYIANYFILERYLIFENIVRATKEFYPNTGDLYQ
jgi:hypothetical protein